MILIALISFVYSKVDKPIVIVVLYIIEGAIAGMVVPAVFAILSMVTDEERRWQYTGIFSTVSSLGIAIGPLVSGLMIKLSNSYNLAFYIAGIGAFVSFILIWLNIKETKEVKKTENDVADNRKKWDKRDNWWT